MRRAAHRPIDNRPQVGNLLHKHQHKHKHKH
jgi:hypothetical protein